jgi:Fur family peroxide stress response transcriptional regulator
METLLKSLKSHNLKVTPQRLAIFSYLYSTVEHPNADTIYKALYPSHPSMSLATVYKTLDALNENNLIQILNVGEDSYRYDANTKPHPHAICVKCHKVYDLNLDLGDYIKKKVNNETEFEFMDEQIYCYVKCPDCQK